MKAVFLDRDGVINEDVHHLHKIKDLKLIEKAPEAIKLLKDKGFKILVVTNQSVIARGIATKDQVTAINNELNNRVKEKVNVGIDAFLICPHHPEGTVKRYTRACICRKPEPGLIVDAGKRFGINLKESYMIGDKEEDIQAGKAAGCKTIKAKPGHLEKAIKIL